jgi:hypothetical protein
MCKFFSFETNGNGEYFYRNAEQRKEDLAKGENPDSHTYIAHCNGYKGAGEDRLNAYEFDPITQILTVDKMNAANDREAALIWVKALDFKTIVPELSIHPIVHPFRDIEQPLVAQEHIDLLRQWASVRASVGASVRASVWASVWDSVRDSVWDSVWASVWAYISSYFALENWKYVEHEPGKNPFQPCIDLWNAGLIASYDGKVWRLHSGKDAAIVWEGKI